MKKLLVILLLIVFWGSPGFARDFIVEYVEENYKETQAQFSYDPIIYHSIQVNSEIGPKILILTGSDYTYRKWLRHYISQNKQLITKIPEDRMGEFTSAKVYKIDVTALHPLNRKKWIKNDEKGTDQEVISGDNHILIIDPVEKRTDLIQTIVKRMGYQCIVFKTEKKALDVFKFQPGKFKMVIAQHMVLEMPAQNFIEQIVEINQKVPIIIDTGYNHPVKNQEQISKLSGFRSVHLTPAILRDLQKTIDRLMNNNA